MYKIRLIFSILLLMGIGQVSAQEVQEKDAIDSMLIALRDTLAGDTLMKVQPAKKEVAQDFSQWRPDPKRALWLALVIPGGGQIYNRKYWKLPLVYGGFIGCLYAMNWNNNMYKDYSQAYLDISDNDPNTQSYNQILIALDIAICGNFRTQMPELIIALCVWVVV